MQLTHKIALFPSPSQETYFASACGTARMVWNWALAEWNKQSIDGLKPNAMALKKQFNAMKYDLYPWLKDIHRDAHAQPFTYLGRAWDRFFMARKAGKPAYVPRFKKKGRCRESFYVANDKFKLEQAAICLPKIGKIQASEELRFSGKILGATVSRQANRWFVAIQVDMLDTEYYKPRIKNGITGVDLGIKAAATLSNGETISLPKPLKKSLRRLRIRGRRLNRKLEAAKVKAGFSRKTRLPAGTKLPTSSNRRKCAIKLAKLHMRIANLRMDFTHKLTTRICRENQAVVIEDLHVKGMLANDKLSRAISDVGFGQIRTQLEYKALRYGTRLVVADRWYPSSRLCSCCDWHNDTLKLTDREWTCPACGIHHDRDVNAALNLKRLAAETALPVASLSGKDDAAKGKFPAAAGKVTPVRYDIGQQDKSGQEKKFAHFCTLY